MEKPNYGANLKLTFEPFLSDWNCPYLSYRHKGEFVPKLQCIVSKYIRFPVLWLPFVQIILKCKGSSSEVPVNYTILSFMSKKFRLVEGNIICRRRNQLVWIIPRRFRYCLRFLQTLDTFHQCYVQKEDADWYRKFLKWMKIDFYDEPLYKEYKKDCCCYPHKAKQLRR